MKTIKNLMFVILFLGTTMVVNATEKSGREGSASSCQEIKTSFYEVIKSDFSKVGNYFYENDINRLKSDVSILFYITSNNGIKILKANSDEEIAVEYVKQLFENTKIDVQREYQNRKFKIILKLDYRAL